jgi:hypothetical protein
VPNVDVTFALNTLVGDLRVTPTAPTVARTNFDGRVQAVVSSGSIATTARVAATVSGSGITTQSDQLTITTGIPDWDSVSLSASTLNPDAFNFDGTEVEIRIALADRFNNPVPDGTAVTLTAEGGAIGSQCLTTAGVCTVDWLSQNPRPIDGRITLLATATGEESFVDGNGDGLFSAAESYTDIGEPFRDDNWDGIRQPSEPFLDFGGANAVQPNGIHDGANGFFNGLLCSGAGCGVSSTVAVSDDIQLTMSGCDLDTSVFPATIDLTGGPVTVGGAFRDARGNPLPALAGIAFTTTNGTLTGTTTRVYPNTSAVQNYTVNLALNAPSSTGVLTITVTCPNSPGTTLSIPVTD